MGELILPFIFHRQKLLGYLLEKIFSKLTCLGAVPSKSLQKWVYIYTGEDKGIRRRWGGSFHCGVTVVSLVTAAGSDSPWVDTQVHSSCFQPPWFVRWTFGLSFWLSLLCISLCFDMHLPHLGSSVTVPPSSPKSKAVCSCILLSALEGLSFHYSQAPAASGLPPLGFRDVLSLPSASPFVICLVPWQHLFLHQWYYSFLTSASLRNSHLSVPILS